MTVNQVKDLFRQLSEMSSSNRNSNVGDVPSQAIADALASLRCIRDHPIHRALFTVSLIFK